MVLICATLKWVNYTMQSQVSELLLEAAALLLIGMVVVFAFLTLMIGAIKLIAWFCEKYPGEQEVAQPFKSTSNQSKTTSGITPETISAISAAVHQYRKAH